MVYTLRFFLFKMQCFTILTYLVPVLFTFYIQDVLKLKNNSGAERFKYKPILERFSITYHYGVSYPYDISHSTLFGKEGAEGDISIY